LIPVSVYIITKNCESTLADTLLSVADFAEIILVDSGSTDKTLEIAQQFNCKIYHQEWLGFAKQKQLALSYCEQDWVLNLDGDEVVSPQLKQEIIDCVNTNTIDGLDIPIEDYFLGFAPDKHSRFNHRIRFFRKAKGGYDLGVEVHESISVQGQVERTKGAIQHYGENSIFVKVTKGNQYSELKAIEKAKKGKRASLLKLVFVIPLTFIKSYLLRRAILNGKRGFITSVLNSYYAFLKEAKLYEQNLKKLAK
jgi:glycosyltransferase involved in cell wall biosynthesis